MKSAIEISIVVISILFALGCQTTPPQITVPVLHEADNATSPTTLSIPGVAIPNTEGEESFDRISPTPSPPTTSEDIRGIEIRKENERSLERQIKTLQGQGEKILDELGVLRRTAEEQHESLQRIASRFGETELVLQAISRELRKMREVDEMVLYRDRREEWKDREKKKDANKER